MNLDKMFYWALLLLIVYVIIGVILYLIQDKFLFQSKKLTADYVFNFNTLYEEVKIPFGENDMISLVKFFPKSQTSRGVVIYYHGNKENINHYAKYADNFTKHGYEVWMGDYPGYGKSTGKRTEAILYDQGLLIEKLAAEKYNSKDIIIYGKSFGTGIASYVASKRECQRLILETPYYSIPEMFKSWAPIYPAAKMCKYKIPTHEYLKQVRCPVTIFHGTTDWIIFYKVAAKLKPFLKPTDEFITIKKGSHNDLPTFDLYQNKLDSLIGK